MTDMLQKTRDGSVIPKFATRPVVLARDNAFLPLGLYQDPPELLYGRKGSSRNITIDQKLEMWNDELISFLMSYLATLLVGGEYDIICRDDEQRRFFQALYGEVHQDLMLKAAPALFFGYQALIKRFHFRLPAPISAEDTDIGWEFDTEPLILRDFLQIHPAKAEPKFSESGSFDGISVKDLQDPIPALYSLWVTCGAWRSFGDYYGYGRCIPAFDPWHKKYFTLDQRTLYIQTGVAPPIMVDFPLGEQEDGTDNSEIAISTGERLKSYGIVGIPSDLHESGNPMEPDAKGRMWDVRYLINNSDPGPLTEIKNDEDRRIALAMLVPAQAVMESQQMGLGGPNTSEVMAEMAERVLSQDALSLDSQINQHVFPFLVEKNFGPKAPPVYKVTKGLNAITRSHLQTVFDAMLGMQSVDSTFIDFKTIANRLNIPTKDSEVVDQEAVQATAVPVPTAPKTNNTPESTKIAQNEQ